VTDDIVDRLRSARAKADMLIGAAPGLAGLAVRVGYVYAVIGVDQTGTEIVVYIGHAKTVHTRLLRSNHPARAFLRAPTTAIFAWPTDAVLNTAVTQAEGKKNPLMAARKQALSVPEQEAIDDIEAMMKEINRGNVPPAAKTSMGEKVRGYLINRAAELPAKGGGRLNVEPVNDIAALEPANLKDYAVRHGVKTPHDAITLKEHNQPFNTRLLSRFMGAASVIMVLLGARDMNMYMHGLVELDTPLPCADDHGIFFFLIIKSGWFSSEYFKYYVNGAWRGQEPIKSSKQEMDLYVEEGRYLYGYADVFGDFVPGLLSPDPIPAGGNWAQL
jgi:hypothetical protein